MNAQLITQNQLNAIIIYNECLGRSVKRKDFKTLTYDEAERKLQSLESEITDMMSEYIYEAYIDSLLNDED